MRETFYLIVRALAGALIGGILGLIGDFATQTEGFWLVGAMAGAIAGLLSLYLVVPSEESKPDALSPGGSSNDDS